MWGVIIAIIGGEGQIECGQGFGFICNPTCKECYEYRDSGLASGPPKLCQRLQRPDELPSAQTEQTFRLPAFRVRLVYAARNKTCVRNLLDTQTCNALLKGCEKQAGLQARCCWNDLHATKTKIETSPAAGSNQSILLQQALKGFQSRADFDPRMGLLNLDLRYFDHLLQSANLWHLHC